jgi:hypothetical protein
VSEQQYDYDQWSEPTRQAPPATRGHGPRRAELVQLFKPFRTGMLLGFGFIFASFIASVVVFGILLLVGLLLGGLPSFLPDSLVP